MHRATLLLGLHRVAMHETHKKARNTLKKSTLRFEAKLVMNTLSLRTKLVILDEREQGLNFHLNPLNYT